MFLSNKKMLRIFALPDFLLIIVLQKQDKKIINVRANISKKTQKHIPFRGFIQTMELVDQYISIMMPLLDG